MNTERINHLTRRIGKIETFLKGYNGTEMEAQYGKTYGEGIQLSKRTIALIFESLQEEIKDHVVEIKKLASE